MPRSTKPGSAPGPEPERLKLEGDWEKRVSEALAKPKPPEGWPKPEPMPQRAPKTPRKK